MSNINQKVVDQFYSYICDSADPESKESPPTRQHHFKRCISQLEKAHPTWLSYPPLSQIDLVSSYAGDELSERQVYESYLKFGWITEFKWISEYAPALQWFFPQYPLKDFAASTRLQLLNKVFEKAAPRDYGCEHLWVFHYHFMNFRAYIEGMYPALYSSVDMTSKDSQCRARYSQIREQ